MNEYLIEPFLKQYYLAEAVYGSLIGEKARKKLFFDLAAVFCVADDPQLEDYYSDSAQEQFAEIRDLPAYERLCRVMEFAQKSGQAVELGERDRMILSQKRAAMLTKAELFRQGKNLTPETIGATLLSMAAGGHIEAMTMLAYMEQHGLCVCRDRDTAQKRIRLCAGWNDLFGNLMGIAYDSDRAERYYNNLGTQLKNASQKKIFAHICYAHSRAVRCEQQPIVRLLERAFGMDIIKRHQYDSAFAKVAYSTLLSVEDKEKLLLTKQKDALSALTDIPFDASDAQPLTFCTDGTDALPLRREEEISRICKSLAVAVNCPAAVYTPLLIVSRDEYVLRMYGEMMKRGFGDTPLIEVDAANLTHGELAAGRDNLFVRGLSETRAVHTVFLIHSCEALDKDKLNELIKMLDYGYRRKFRLSHPPISLDLSGVLPVLLVRDGAAAQYLAPHCDSVQVAPVQVEEKGSVIDALFRARTVCYGCGELAMESDCKAFLADYDTGLAAQIVDGAIRNAIYERTGVVTLSGMRAVCEERNITRQRRGFGYIGGNTCVQ